MEPEEWTPVFTTHYDVLQAGSIDKTDTHPHDRAIARALYAEYKPNNKVDGDPEYTVFISRLNHITTEDKMREIFSRFGTIRRIRVVRDIVTGYSKGYGFIEYEDQASTRKAWAQANGMVIDDKPVFIDYEHERNMKGWVPRRLGGGLGGRKESGQLRFGGRDKPFKKPIIVPEKPRKDELDISSLGSYQSQSRRARHDRDTERSFRRDANPEGHRRRRSQERDPEVRRTWNSRRSRSRSRDRNESLDRRGRY